MAGAAAVAGQIQMRRRNVDVTEDLQISFREIFVGEPGHFIHDQPFDRTNFYYEIRVDRVGPRSVLNYGLTPRTLCLSNSLPDNDVHSTVYKVTDGYVWVGVTGRQFNEFDKSIQAGDVFGCGIKYNFEIGSSVPTSDYTIRKVFFTKNRQELCYVYQKVSRAGFCPYVGLGSDDRTEVQLTFPALCGDYVMLMPPAPIDGIWALSRFFNVIGDGESLEYFGEGTTDAVQNGFAQAKRPLTRFRDYFTVTLGDLGEGNRIMVGVACRNFPKTTVLGMNRLSVGLFLEMGVLVCYDRGLLQNTIYGPPMVGDVIKVKVIFPDGYEVPPRRRLLPRGDTSEDVSSDLDSATSRSEETASVPYAAGQQGAGCSADDLAAIVAVLEPFLPDRSESGETSAAATFRCEPKPEPKPGQPGSEEQEAAKDETQVSESGGHAEGEAPIEQLEASGSAAGEQSKPPSPGPEIFSMRRSVLFTCYSLYTVDH